MDLTKNTAIITGASRGLGLAIAQRLVEEGITVVGWSRSAPEFEHPLFHWIATDLTSDQSVSQSFTETQEKVGKAINILINNAGIGPKIAMEKMEPAAWREVFDLNVHGLFYASRLVIPGMKKLQYGHIINISSGAGTNGIPNMTAYCGTKHAVHGISHAMHSELRGDGIKVTCLSPGSIETGFGASDGEEKPRKNRLQPNDMASAILHVITMPKNFHYTDMEVRPLQP